MMSASSGKTQNTSGSESKAGLKVVSTSPDGRSLIFKNKGLFAENYLVNRLPNERNDSFVMRSWQTEDLPEFSACYEWMLSTWEEYKDILPTLSEAQLEERWIRPILQRLGWEYEVQDRLQKRGKTQIPDYSLFCDSAQYKKAKQCKTHDQYFSHVEAIADAKAMGIDLDGTGKTNANPSYQIVRYLEDTEKDWGILTDGEYWRLYYRGSKSRYTTYYEVNVRKLLVPSNGSPRNDLAFKYFFNFFSRSAFAERDVAEKNFLDIVYESGERYAQVVERELKARAFRIVEMIAQGFLWGREKVPEAEMAQVYTHSLYFLFRLMFVLNCESKGLLDVTNLSNYYPYSLRSIAWRLRKEFERSTQWSRTARVYDEIRILFGIIKDGDASIGVHGFGTQLFKGEQETFYAQYKIPDFILNRAIVELACAYSESGDLQYVDFARLGADHIGSIFEGLLEYRLDFADKDYQLSRDGTLVPFLNPQGAQGGECIKKGSVILVNDSGERKNTGAYYTPNAIVDYICKSTLESLCKGLSAEDLLKVQVCDPAVGSGHFLLGVVRYLEERLLERLYQEDEKAADIDAAEIRWKVLHNCVFGADINPLAIELTKFSLWIYTARKGYCLEPLDDQLVCGNSLTENIKLHGITWKDTYPTVFKKSGGFDAIVGNPPYVFARNKKFSEDEKTAYSHYKFSGYQVNTYGLFVERALQLLGDEGRLGFILPNNWLTISTMGQFRKALLSSVGEVAVVNNQYQVFETASVDTSIIVAAKKGTAKIQLLESKAESEFKLIKEEKLTAYRDGRVINFTSRQGGVDPNVIKDKIREHSVQLNTVAEVKTGLKAYQIGKGKPKQTVKEKAGRIFHSERRISKEYRQYLEGKNVCRYFSEWSGQYLKYGAHLAEPRNAALFEGERILIRQIPSKPPLSINSCIVDGEELNDINSMIVKSTGKYDNRFLLGVLNSRMMSFWFDLQFQKFQRKIFPQFKVKELAQFPVPQINFEDRSELDTYRFIIDKVTAIQNSLKQFKDARPHLKTIEKMDLEIESALAKLFKLSDADLEFILEYYTKLNDQAPILKISA